MTRKECAALLQNPKYVGDNCAIIFFRSPISDAVDRRVIWAENYAESVMWLNAEIEKYKEWNIPYLAYICGGLFAASDGVFFKEEECKDE